MDEEGLHNVEAKQKEEKLRHWDRKKKKMSPLVLGFKIHSGFVDVVSVRLTVSVCPDEEQR